jgi:nucleoside-diphosphate-sugar epimerase
LTDPAFTDATFTAVDTAIRSPANDRRLRAVEGDLRDPGVRREALGSRPDIVFHLAGILGGAAEAHYALAREVNVDATLSLFEDLRDEMKPPRVVFTSSIAVFGPLDAGGVDDDTRASPHMFYGAQKRMMEIALENFSARGWLDGLALRLPGIVARRGADARMKAAFLSHLFYAIEAGRDYTLPVSPDGTSWLLSVPACVDALVHAALLPRERLGERRALTLPALRVSMQQLTNALAKHFPGSSARIDHAPDLELERQFARQPPLVTALADELGFKHDGTVEALLRRAIEPQGPVSGQFAQRDDR